MIFSEKTKGILEFDKITAMLAGFCSVKGAKQRALSLTPTDDPVEVARRLARTTDARRLLCHKGYPPFDANEEIPASCERAEKGATLSCQELLAIAALLRATKACYDYGHTDRTFATCLDEIFARLMPNKTLESRISGAILAPDVIADNASPALWDIRRSIRAAQGRIKESSMGYVSGNKSRALQEQVVTLRDGRYVIPVKQEYRSEVKGIIHDTSSSGATVFIEPMAVVDANNDLRALQIREEREIERILAELSALCGDCATSLALNYRNMVELSYIFGCAGLAESMRATCPTLLDTQEIELRRARHPLIDKDRVVPVTVGLGGEYDTLIITGPNTGGKTVTLKTLGLFAAMAQSGLHIPCDEGSRTGIFDAILVDIGDEQSIEASLSTFSSHMVTVAEILANMTDKSLLLFDELGAGTDPVEGAALAIAILEHARTAGALSCATTHYTELKMYALDTPRVINASCEFDIETLRPTYRLIVGAPGKSNAFAISGKLGIPAEVISAAQALVAEDNRRFENVLEQLDAARTEMERAREETERMRREYEQFKHRAEEDLARRTREAEQAIQRDREKARQLLDSARVNSEFVFKQLDDLRRKQEKGIHAKDLEEARRLVREELRRGEAQYSEADFLDPAEEEYTPSRPLKVGDRVYITTYHAEGEITALCGKKQLEVRAGVFRGRVDVREVRLLDDMKRAPKKAEASQSKVTRGGVAHFKPELDIRGRYGDEGWYEVDRYLDEAVLSGVEIVRIIHGKGTGALRVALHKELKADPRVKSFRLGELGEGDSGVTVVTLK